MTLEEVIVLFIVPIVGGLAVALLGAIAGAWIDEKWIRDRLVSRTLRDLLNFNRTLDVVFVFPTRGAPPGHERGEVAWEDMRAVEYIQSDLLASGFPRTKIKYRGLKLSERRLTADDARQLRTKFTSGWPAPELVSKGIVYPKFLRDFDEKDFEEYGLRLRQHDKEQNLVLICSPKSNKATEEVLARLGLEWAIVPDPQTPLDAPVPWWKLRFFNNQEWESEAFRQPDAEGNLHDWAVVAKLTSPFNEDAKVLIIFGVRGTGTWGGARYFARHLDLFHKRFGPDDFACRVRVTYSCTQWRMFTGSAQDLVEEKRGASVRQPAIGVGRMAGRDEGAT